MTLRLRSPLLTLATLCLFVVSCVTTQLPPISSSGSHFEPLKDEAELWGQARVEERKLLDEVPLYDDPLLEDYLETVVSRLNPASMAANEQIRFQVRVIEDPTLNAFAYPHGSVYVHTGLLARMENESQLATVLGHEMTHVENRHTIRYHRTARNRQIGFSIAAITAAVILANEEGDAWAEGDWGEAAMIGVLGDVLVGLGLQLAFLASVNGYGRDLEREADFGSFDKMENAGYDLRESPRVYELLQDGHGESGSVEAFFFGSHPKLSQRVENAKLHLTRRPQDAESLETDDESALTFERRIRPVLRDDARHNIEIGRFDLASFELERALELLPTDAEAYFLVGRLKLARAEVALDAEEEAALEAEATTALREAVRLAPDQPEAHRELGLLAYRNEDFTTACAELAAFVELAPDEDDTQSFRGYLLELEQDGHCAAG